MRNISLQARRTLASAARPYDSEPVPSASRVLEAGLDYSCFEGVWSYVPEFRDLLPAKSGRNRFPRSISAFSRRSFWAAVPRLYRDAHCGRMARFPFRSPTGPLVNPASHQLRPPIHSLSRHLEATVSIRWRGIKPFPLSHASPQVHGAGGNREHRSAYFVSCLDFT